MSHFNARAPISPSTRQQLLVRRFAVNFPPDCLSLFDLLIYRMEQNTFRTHTQRTVSWLAGIVRAEALSKQREGASPNLTLNPTRAILTGWGKRH